MTTKYAKISLDRVSFTDYAELSAMYRDLVERMGATASGRTGPLAPDCDIYDAEGEIVAHMSYNGRVWAGKRSGWTTQTELLYCPASTNDKEKVAIALKPDEVDPRDVIRIAKAFRDEMRRELPQEILERIDHKNWQSGKDGCCASHDYCDSNTLMGGAFVSVMGRESLAGSSKDVELWNRAWYMAADQGFAKFPLEDLGFEIEQMGGGCTAWQFTLKKTPAGEETEWIIAGDPEGGHHAPDAEGNIFIGFSKLVDGEVVNSGDRLVHQSEVKAVASDMMFRHGIAGAACFLQRDAAEEFAKGNFAQASKDYEGARSALFMLLDHVGCEELQTRTSQ